MTRQQKRRQRQRLWCEAQALIKETKRAKKIERNDKRKERRKRKNRGLLTTQPAYHEKMREADNQQRIVHKREQDLRQVRRRQRQRRRVAIFLAMKEAA